jgi:hypothetical protein
MESFITILWKMALEEQILKQSPTLTGMEEVMAMVRLLMPPIIQGLEAINSFT